MVSVSYFYLDTSGAKVFVKKFIPPVVRGVVQIAHGMGETADYYDSFAQNAAGKGFAVYIGEARGHGRTAGDIAVPGYGGGNVEGGMCAMANDLHETSAFIRKKHAAPVFLLAHSMGTVAAQLCVASHPQDYAGLVLAGLPFFEKVDALLQTAEQEYREQGPKSASKRTFFEVFGGLNHSFEPVLSPLDWITSDRQKISESLSTPYSAVLFNNAFYLDFLSAAKKTQDAAFAQKLPRSLPILLLAGGDDPIAHRGASVRKKREALQKAGGVDVEESVYANMRHSLLREKNCSIVENDILNFMTRIVGNDAETGMV